MGGFSSVPEVFLVIYILRNLVFTEYGNQISQLKYYQNFHLC